MGIIWDCLSDLAFSCGCVDEHATPGSEWLAGRPLAPIDISTAPCGTAPWACCSFDEQVQNDVALVPDGFVYLRAQPGTCMQRLRKR